MPPTFGLNYLMPLLPGFMARYPRIKPEWHFESRPVDLITEGYDAAIGGGFELSPGIVIRTLAPAHLIAVASPVYMRDRVRPADPTGLGDLDGIVMRNLRSGRIRHRTMRDVAGREVLAPVRESIVVNEPAAMREAALLGLGFALLAMPDALSALDDGSLIRLVPRWYCDAGAISIYYPSRTLLPAKSRAFIDWVGDAFKAKRLAERFAGSLA